MTTGVVPPLFEDGTADVAARSSGTSPRLTNPHPPSPQKKAKSSTGDALTPYEAARAKNIATNAERMRSLGVEDAAKKVAGTKRKAPSSSAKQPAAPAAPARRSSRARAEVSYKEPTMKEFEAAFAAEDDGTAAAGAAAKAARSTASRSGYAPAEPKFPFAPSLDLTEGARDAKTGKLVFKDHPEFTPNLTPRQVIQAGSWGGVYFHPRGGKPGIRGRDVAVTHSEFPKEWFAGLKPEAYRARRYDHTRNKYRVKAGQDQAFWEEHGWIIDQDPRGWFQWYCRFYLGRRTADDARQISRWCGVAGAKGRWKTALCKKCVYANKRWDDQSVSPVIRQTMLHWAYEITEQDVKDVMKRM